MERRELKVENFMKMSTFWWWHWRRWWLALFGRGRAERHGESGRARGFILHLRECILQVQEKQSRGRARFAAA